MVPPIEAAALLPPQATFFSSPFHPPPPFQQKFSCLHLLLLFFPSLLQVASCTGPEPACWLTTASDATPNFCFPPFCIQGWSETRVIGMAVLSALGLALLRCSSGWSGCLLLMPFCFSDWAPIVKQGENKTNKTEQKKFNVNWLLAHSGHPNSSKKVFPGHIIESAAGGSYFCSPFCYENKNGLVFLLPRNTNFLLHASAPCLVGFWLKFFMDHIFYLIFFYSNCKLFLLGGQFWSLFRFF